MVSSKEYEKLAGELRTAMDGMGTDEDALIEVIAGTTNYDRQELKKYYKSSFGRDLVEDLDSELSSNFKKVVLALFMDPIDYDVHELYYAMKGLGTNEDTLIEILATRPTSILTQIKDRFKEKYKDTLEYWVCDETSGDFKKLLVSLLQCNRSENTVVDNEKAKKEAKELYDAGEGKWGTDESTFNRIFSLRSPRELYAISQYYSDISGNTLLKAVDSEFSGDIKKCLQTILYGLISPSEYFASRIKAACKGLGTSDSILIRVIVSRLEIDMKQIRQCYENMYGIQLLAEIEDETSGDYKKLLMKLVSK